MGKAINACSGSGSCKATRDCSLTKGSDLAGSCMSKVCAPDPTVEAQSKKSGSWGAPDLSCLTMAR